MKKVLFVMDTLTLGGSQKVLLNLLNLCDGVYDVDLLLVNEYGVFLKDVPENVSIYSIFSFHKQIPLSELNNYRFSDCLKSLFYKSVFRGNVYLNYIERKANSLVANNSYDYVVGFQEGPSNYISANLKTDATKIGWLHSDIHRLNRKQTLMERGVYEQLDAILCVSNFVKEAALSKYPSLASKLRVIYNPIDIKSILAKSQLALSASFSSGNNLISIGRLSPEKNFDLLIERLAPYLHKKPEDSLHIIGEGPEKAKILALIEKNVLSDQVFLHGFKDNPYSYLSRSDIYISSSAYEGLPTTIIESMLLSKKILANDISANRELLDDYEQAEFYNIDDADSLIPALEKLIRNSQSGYTSSIESKVSYEKFLYNFETVIQSTLNKQIPKG